MSLFADTSVWSLALRRDTQHPAPEVGALANALARGQTVFVAGLVLQELLQGLSGPKARMQIIERFAKLPLLSPDIQDHIEAAELRNHCRRSGVQIATVDVLFAQLCIRYDLTMLATDKDFTYLARHSALRLWSP